MHSVWKADSAALLIADGARTSLARGALVPGQAQFLRRTRVHAHDILDALIDDLEGPSIARAASVGAVGIPGDPIIPCRIGVSWRHETP